MAVKDCKLTAVFLCLKKEFRELREIREISSEIRELQMHPP